MKKLKYDSRGRVINRSKKDKKKLVDGAAYQFAIAKIILTKVDSL